MREITINQARDEIEVLDQVSAKLQDALQSKYADLRANNLAFRNSGEDAEIAAEQHRIRRSLIEALEEVGRRGYGRVVYVREEEEDGKVLREGAYRISQANASLPEAWILARNSPLGSQIASCRVGDELEVRLPKSEKYFVVKSLIDLEGAVQLLRANPDIKLAHFHLAAHSDVDTIRDVRAYLAALSAPAEVAAGLAIEAPSPESEVQAGETTADLFWPSDWSNVILADEPEAALGAQFFTRTTLHQEEAIRAVRGVTVVDGIAGTGKTSIALGRLKFFANFRSGEHLEDYGLDPNDWMDFDSTDMIGFVLSPSLVQYLKQTAEDLEMRMRIMDFDEFRNQERQLRHLFSRPYRRSPDRNVEVQQTVRWLEVLADAACLHLSMNIETIQQEALAKPDSPDGNRVTEARWRQIESQLWTAGPLRARLVGLARQLKGGGSPYRLQGIASTIDKEIRLSDRETASLTPGERRAVREAVLNISLRLFRLLNPSDLYVDVHKTASLADRLAARFPEQAEAALEAAERTVERLGKRLITDDDVVTALCLNALTCDQFERDIRDIPYVRTFSDRVGVFIDEYQDFSEQQIFLMGFRTKQKYRQITVAGDGSQRLHAGGVERIANAFPYVGDAIRQITLDTNFRQTKPLARLSNCFRTFTGGGAEFLDEEPCNAPVYTYEDQQEFAEFVALKISALPDAASVVVISPTPETAKAWYELMRPSLESAFRNPIVSDRARLTERLKTHFTTPLEAKGLEFDVAVVPDIAEFDENDTINLNGLYVAVSRPRYALLLGCAASRVDHDVIAELSHRADLSLVPLRACEAVT